MSLHKFFTVTCPKKRKLSDALDCNGNIVKPDKNCREKMCDAEKH